MTWPEQGLGQFGVATWSFEVTTWGRLLGRVATSARPASAQPALVVRATCARPVGCVRSSAHDLGTARVVCTRLGFWMCALCTQPSFDSVHCLQSLFGSLFMKTVHRVKKKYKNFKNFLVYVLIYEIFILKLV